MIDWCLMPTLAVSQLYRGIIVMKRKFKQWWSTIPQISTKRIITSHLKSLNIKKTMIYGIGKPDLGLGQAQKWCWIKPVNGIPTWIDIYKIWSFSLLWNGYYLKWFIFLYEGKNFVSHELWYRNVVIVFLFQL